MKNFSEKLLSVLCHQKDYFFLVYVYMVDTSVKNYTDAKVFTIKISNKNYFG